MTPEEKQKLIEKAMAAKAKKLEEAKKQPTGTKGEGKKEPVSTYDPYAGFSEEQLSEILAPETPLRKAKVSGKQTKTGEGVYGSEVSLEDWIKRNPEYAKSFESKYGKKFDPSKDSETFQKEYNQHVEDLAYKRALDAGYPDDQAKKIAKGFKLSQGFQEGKKAGDPRGVDKMFGEYTSSRFEPIFKPFKKEAPEKEQDITLTKKAKTEASKEDIKRYSPTPKKVGEYAPWWLQDIIKTSGAAADLARVKKYEPWQATPAVALPSATFYDPTRELAANTEAANLAMQAQQAFTNPQQLAAASSVAQGQMARNAADIMGRYNNLNVGLANQLEQQRTDIINTTNQNKANLNTQLWDKYTIANQQFDNAKAQARQNLRQSYMDAITNRAKTQALNTLYPNYYTDPSRGGFVNFAPGFTPTPTSPTDTDPASQVRSLMKSIPGLEPKDALNYLKSQKDSSGDSDERQAILRSLGYTG